jgi:hypothetical protein
MRFREIPPNLNQIDRQRLDHERRLNAAAGKVIDAKTRAVQDRQRSAMAAADLGNLGRAVKIQTGRSTDENGAANAFGVIYADNGDTSRAGEALKVYGLNASTTILPVKGNWLWFQTDVIRRTAKVPGASSRTRLTPERYRQLGSPLGPLQFAQINPRLAKLYVEEADISVKNGLASRPGKRRSRTKVRHKRVTVFFGIKVTRRGQRYDALAIVRQAHGEIPRDIAAAMAAAGPA